MKCDYPDCAKPFESGEIVYCSKYSYRARICKRCAGKEIMSNIKITAEVDGKQVPLENISTETFEAIKALEKPKEIPVASIGTYHDKPRLFLKITDEIKEYVAEGYRIIAIRTENGTVSNCWSRDIEITDLSWQYKNIKPL